MGAGGPRAAAQLGLRAAISLRRNLRAVGKAGMQRAVGGIRAGSGPQGGHTNTGISKNGCPALLRSLSPAAGGQWLRVPLRLLRPPRPRTARAGSFGGCPAGGQCRQAPAPRLPKYPLLPAPSPTGILSRCHVRATISLCFSLVQLTLKLSALPLPSYLPSLQPHPLATHCSPIFLPGSPSHVCKLCLLCNYTRCFKRHRASGAKLVNLEEQYAWVSGCGWSGRENWAACGKGCRLGKRLKGNSGALPAKNGAHGEQGAESSMRLYQRASACTLGVGSVKRCVVGIVRVRSAQLGC